MREIGRARSSILVQAYSFTSALLQRPSSKPRSAAILDKRQRTERYTGAAFLKNEGIPVMIDAAHNKVMVIDSGVVITGSFNFIKSSEERNAENLLVIRSPELAKIYSANWADHKKHSECILNAYLPI